MKIDYLYYARYINCNQVYKVAIIRFFVYNSLKIEQYILSKCFERYFDAKGGGKT